MRYLMIHWIDETALDGVAATPREGKVVVTGDEYQHVETACERAVIRYVLGKRG